MKKPTFPENKKIQEGGCLLPLVGTIIFFISCSSPQKTAKDFGSLNLYQPPIIILEGGKEVITKEGKYTPQTDETWHSDYRYRELERKLYQD